MNRYASARIFFLLCGLLPAIANSDETAARLAMENNSNPLMLVTTSQGNIFVELLPQEAPRNVERFLALSAGEMATGDPLNPRNFYDGLRFHRVIPGFLIQAGSPAYNPAGESVPLLNDEISASALGLDSAQLILPDGSINPLLAISDRATLEESLLLPLYRQLRIADNEAVVSRQFAIADRLRQMTVRQAYELLGYRYDDLRPTRSVSRGTLVLANQGPNTNGPEFFIPVIDAPWLNGRNTVIGRIVDGMDVVDRISRFAIDPLTENRQSTLIFSIRRL